MEAYDQRYDVAVYSTVERPEFLLCVILVDVLDKLTFSFLDYYGDTFFQSAGTQ